MRPIRLDLVRQAHFVGAGGIGVSAVAQILHAHGVRCTGSDLANGPAVRKLQRLGIKIAVGPHAAINVPAGCDLVVHTLAAPAGNPELRAARRRKIPTWSYPVLLGELMRGKYAVTVSGTHGKTTTTAMLAEALVAARLDPTVVVGSFVRTLGGNARVGHGRIFVAEACEYQRAFLHYAPNVTVLTTIEPDHLDTYGTFAELVRTFERYMHSLPLDGWLVANSSDPVVRRVARAARCPVLWYPAATRPELNLRVPGAHNRTNASAALAAAELLGADPAVARSAIERFTGTWRRFEVLGTVRGITVVDDYAHHPTAVRATLAAAHEKFPRRRLVVLFEPHHEHRLRSLYPAFTRCFDGAYRVLLAPVYQVAGRDRTVKRPKTSDDLARAVRLRGVNAEALPSLDAAESRLARILRPGDVLLVLGAGTVTRIAHRALRFLRVV